MLTASQQPLSEDCKLAMTELITLAEVARYLHVHPSTIYRLVKKGKLPALKVGSDWRFNRESIDQWLAAAEKAAAPADMDSADPDDSALLLQEP